MKFKANFKTINNKIVKSFIIFALVIFISKKKMNNKNLKKE